MKTIRAAVMDRRHKATEVGAQMPMDASNAWNADESFHATRALASALAASGRVRGTTIMTERIPERCYCGDPWCKRCFPSWDYDEVGHEQDSDEEFQEGGSSDPAGDGQGDSDIPAG